MKASIARVTALATITTVAGLVIAGQNVKADTTTATTAPDTTQTTATMTTTPNYVQLYSDNLNQVKATQNINIPDGYTLDAVRNVNGPAAAQALEKSAQQGLYTNDYQSDSTAAQERVDVNNLTSDQVAEMNQYGLSVVNKVRSEFGEEPFVQNEGTINETRNVALQYQAKNESLLNGGWHDFAILNGRSENIAAQQIYIDNVSGLRARPFAEAKGRDFVDNSAVPLFTITTMDDLRASIFYGVMGMLFNDAADNFGHAQNFLTVNQPVTAMALYPSLTYGTGTGRYANGTTFKFQLENIDMHYVWTSGTDFNANDYTNAGTVVGNWDQNDNGNYAYLDGAHLTTDGAIIATGWHATNASQGRAYHYIIALDQNGHELGRTLVNPVTREDVRAAHNVYNAVHSGFSVKIDLGNALANTTAVQLISRYSSDAAGNAGYVDYWFAPVAVDQANRACLDQAKVTDGQLHLTGWHATNKAANRPYHYLIVLNNGREVARQLVTDGVNRADVANVYPDVDRAAKSGFDVRFAVDKLNFNQRIQVLSRYTDDPAGNGNAVDYYFAPLTEGNYANLGHLDNFSISGVKLNIAGWHANAVSQFEQHRFIILYDSTANRQVASFNVDNVARPDVQRVYPGITGTGQSGFNLSLDLKDAQIVPGHQYVVISRYSSSATGNGNGNGSQYADYWYPSKVLENGNEAGNLDKWTVQPAGAGQYTVTAAGWHATRMVNPVHTLILFDNTLGREVSRHTLTYQQTGLERLDVARAVGNQYPAAGQSGFNVQWTVTGLRPGDDYTLISRYSLTSNADQDYVDYDFPIGKMNIQ